MRVAPPTRSPTASAPRISSPCAFGIQPLTRISGGQAPRLLRPLKSAALADQFNWAPHPGIGRPGVNGKMGIPGGTLLPCGIFPYDSRPMADATFGASFFLQRKNGFLSHSSLVALLVVMSEVAPRQPLPPGGEPLAVRIGGVGAPRGGGCSAVSPGGG
jgi:hypothetical protein